MEKEHGKGKADAKTGEIMLDKKDPSYGLDISIRQEVKSAACSGGSQGASQATRANGSKMFANTKEKN